MSVLIADDCDVFRRSLQRMLPFESNTCSTIDDAVIRAGSWQPGVVLLDVFFDEDGRSGIDAIRDIRAVCQRCQIIIMTGFYSDSDAARSLSAGAFAYVEKGDPRVLVSTVRLARRHVRVPFLRFPSLLQ